MTKKEINVINELKDEDVDINIFYVYRTRDKMGNEVAGSHYGKSYNFIAINASQMKELGEWKHLVDAHEIGHELGLPDLPKQPKYEDRLMYGVFTPDRRRLVKEEWDKSRKYKEKKQ